MSYRNNENRIPKIIHYCWFGRRDKNKFVNKCISTWKSIFPNYKIMEWNEDNFPIDYNDYVKEAYKYKKYAFVSDVARLYALKEYGGIYFDTDIEAMKSIDSYLYESEVIMAFESDRVVMTGFLAARKKSRFIEEWLNKYQNLHFLKADGTYDEIPNTFRVSDILKRKGLILNGMKQTLQNGVTVYPKEIFGAYDVDNSAYVITDDTVVIHHCKSSWMPFKYKAKDNIKRMVARILGVKIYNKIRMKVRTDKE